MPDTVRTLKVKGSGSSERMRLSPFYLGLVTHKTKGKEERMEKREKRAKRDVIAYRKKCKTDGAGLSHYILMDKKGK
jgi:modified peptide precursor CbpA